MTPLQKSILSAVKRRPMTLRELQNNLQVDNSRLRTTVSAMVAPFSRARGGVGGVSRTASLMPRGRAALPLDSPNGIVFRWGGGSRACG